MILKHEQKKLKFILLTLLFLLNMTLVFSQDTKIPNYTNLYVNDFANILNTQEKNYLINLYTSIENKTTAEITFVSIEICSPLEPSEYAQKIGDEWKVGKEDIDNGLIILYCKEENKIWLATGYGLEGILPDSKLGRILDEYYVPYKDTNMTSEGILQTSEEIAKILEENKDEISSNNTLNSSKLSEEKETFLLYIIPTLIIFIMLITQIIHFVKTEKMYNMKYSLDAIFWISIIIYYFVGIAIEIIIMFIIYYIIARGFLAGNFSNGKGGGGGFSGGGFSGGGSFGGGSFGGGGVGR